MGVFPGCLASSVAANKDGLSAIWRSRNDLWTLGARYEEPLRERTSQHVDVGGRQCVARLHQQDGSCAHEDAAEERQEACQGKRKNRGGCTGADDGDPAAAAYRDRLLRSTPKQ